MNEQTMITVLAALLHDLGKFWQRAGRAGPHYEASAAFVDEFEHLFPYAWRDDVRDGAGNHHRPARKEVEKIVKVADWLASAEREELAIPQSDPGKTPLLPVAARVEFREEKPRDWQQWGLRLSVLDLEERCIFPTTEARVSPEDYRHLWGIFEIETRRLGGMTDYFTLVGLLALLRKYGSFIPSATPWEADEEYRTLPDISLYDHLKVAAAIAACLTRLYPDHVEALYLREQAVKHKPVARLLRADFSGIQNFLYRITRAEPTAEFRNTAKRLRGRSLFLALLADVTADWLARELELSPANILFCGGGRFDLIIGADEATKQNLNALNQRLQHWLANQFHGELGIQFAAVDLVPSDFEDLERTFAALDDNLAREKQQKFRDALETARFFVTTEPLYHVCNYCHVTPLPGPDAEPCPSCRLQRDLGGKLPRTEYLAYLHGDGEDFPLPNGAVIIDLSEPFGVRVALLSGEEAKKVTQTAAGRTVKIVLYRLNDTNFLRDDFPPSVSGGFKFFGNTAPFAEQRIDPVKVGKERVEPGEVLDFDEVAFMSSGTQLLGVLKADVDYLGQVFGLGVKPKSISRVATLSSALDLFFAGWINRICEQLAHSWHTDPQNENLLKGKVNGLFYIVYSGGDDLLIVGPWNAIIDLSQRLYSDFHRYTCLNPNITLSAGILLVKPHFPIQRFAQLAGERLEQAKTVGEHQDRPGLNRKDRITLFRETVRWQENDKSFDRLLEFGKNFEVHVGEDKLPRSFIYFLMRLHAQYFLKDGEQSFMWVPKLHYALARRVSREVIADEELNLPNNLVRFMAHIRIPTSYVSLKMRRE